MLKSSLVSGVLLLSVTAGFVVADERQQLTKNPFLQPDILSYRPPVQVTQPQGRVEPEVWEPPTLELKAVISSQSGLMALVDDSFLEVGDEYEDMRLITIMQDSVTFRYKRKNYVYNLVDEPIGTR